MLQAKNQEKHEPDMPAKRGGTEPQDDPMTGDAPAEQGEYEEEERKA